MGQVVHVVPVNDVRTHDSTGPGCSCHPVTELVAGGGQVVVHNAWDKRELREKTATR